MSKAIEEFIYLKIPLSKSMGFSLVEVTRDKAEIFFPLAPNRNHHGTAFGGSLSAAHLLACYVWLFNFLKVQNLEAKTEIVVKESRMRFLRPVEKDFTLICESPSLEDCDQFLKTLHSKNRSRLNLLSTVSDKGTLLSSMQAEFVASQTRL